MLSAKRAYLATELSALGFEVLPAQGTYFLVADFKGLLPDGCQESDVEVGRARSLVFWGHWAGELTEWTADPAHLFTVAHSSTALLLSWRAPLWGLLLPPFALPTPTLPCPLPRIPFFSSATG
jgi:hypothetical protein